MNKKFIIFGISIFFITVCFIGCLEDNKTKEQASTKDFDIYVDVNGNADYKSIQDAIDNSSDGVKIFVHKGKYHEKRLINSSYYVNLIINKSITLQGEDKNSTIIDGSEVDNVVSIVANDVKIFGFKIQNSGEYAGHNAGIEVSSNYSYISNNIISNNTGPGI